MPPPSHPPRLQHSPSLPNIWFPPHSRPIPPQLDTMSRESILHKDSVKKQPDLKPSLVPQSRPHVKIAAQKPDRRQRVESVSHKLLTPPLTPASSIRTSASVDSSSPQITAEISPSRFLLISNCSPTVPHQVVETAIEASIAAGKFGSVTDTPIKGYFFGALSKSGLICLAFHDLRDAVSAKNYFDSNESDEFDQRIGQPQDAVDRQRISCKFLTMDQVSSQFGSHAFLDSMNASLELVVEPEPPLDENDDEHVKKLEVFFENDSEIRSFEEIKKVSNCSCKRFRIECYDIRHIPEMRKLNGQVMFGIKLNIKPDVEPDPVDPESKTAEKPAIEPFPISRGTIEFGPPGHSSQTRQPFSFPIDGPRNASDAPSTDNRSSGSPPFFYTSDTNGSVRLASNLPSAFNIKPLGEGPIPLHSRHRLLQNYYNADEYPPQPYDGPPMPGPLVGPFFPPTPTSPHGFLPLPPHFPGAAPLHSVPGGMVPFEHDPAIIQMGWPFEMINAYPSAFHLNAGVPLPPLDPFWQAVAPPGFANGANSSLPPGLPPTPSTPYFVPSAPGEPQQTTQEGSPPRKTSPPLIKNAPTSPPSMNGKKEPSEHNQLNLGRIEEGLDTRTTIMIKNIPNKMTDKDLMAYIAQVCHRRIDFLYLRMDFKNGCNVGYAFVNFISVDDLLKFAKERLGHKWNMFSSEKVLQISYANYQGKEALVEKFKNSCIMDEREAWQPKIFYSEPGPEQGLPEPFPAATHQRRKERSSYNRGALYVPGNSTLHTQNLLNAPFSSRRLEHSEPRQRNHRRQRTTTTGE